jgi:hypothetical protein
MRLHPLLAALDRDSGFEALVESLRTPGRGGPQALGLCGPTRIGHDYAEKIRNRDVSGYVGSEHLFATYLCAPGDASLIWKYSSPATAPDTKTGG